MTEEQKKATCGCGCASKGVVALFKFLIGIVLIVLGVFLCMRWWLALAVLIKGCLGPVLILIGLVFLAIAKE